VSVVLGLSSKMLAYLVFWIRRALDLGVQFEQVLRDALGPGLAKIAVVQEEVDAQVGLVD